MAIDSIISAASARVAGAIRDAARSTGASFEYLLTAARIESNLNPAAQASSSSAKGLYQFIDQTWLATLKNAGPAHGYGQYADAITMSADGHYEVADPNQRAAIMRLRSDPTASATMAGAFTQNNATQLATAIGRMPTEGELYIAHFLGSDGASRLINAATTQPRTNATNLFPQAAAANPGIFRNKAGQPRSAGEVYAALTGRFEVARAIAFAPGSRGGSGAQGGSPDTADVAGAGSPDTAGLTQAYAQANATPMASAVPIPAVAPEARPFFQTMFTDRGSGAVAQTVSNLWAPSKNEAPAAPDPSLMLNLFSDAPARPRKATGGKV
ncbi:MAG: lytic transglycosylase domain-containing protein [Pseudolabrys sp.]